MPSSTDLLTGLELANSGTAIRSGWVSEERPGKGKGALCSLCCFRTGEVPPPFNPPHLHNTDSWAWASQPTCGSCLWGGRPAAQGHAHTQLPRSRTPSQCQSQAKSSSLRACPPPTSCPAFCACSSRGPSPWLPDRTPVYISSSQHLWGQASCPAVPTLRSSHNGSHGKGSLQTSVRSHARPLYLLSTTSCKVLHASTPLSPCLSLYGPLRTAPQAACSCSRAMHCGSLWVFAWLIVFLTQVWAPLPPPQEGQPEAASCRRPGTLPCVAARHSQVLVLLEMAPFLALLAYPSSVFPAGLSVPQSLKSEGGLSGR